MPTVWIKASWGDQEPGPAEWRSVSFTANAEPMTESLATLLAAFASAVHGVQAATFRVSGLTLTLRSWLAQDHGDQSPYVGRLLGSPALAEALPDVARGLDTATVDLTEAEFAWIHPLNLAASLALQLSSETAYDSGPPISTAKKVADTFVEQVIGERFEQFHVADSNDPWSDWFYDIVPTWDHTWLITDLRDDLATLICVTDTD